MRLWSKQELALLQGGSEDRCGRAHQPRPRPSSTLMHCSGPRLLVVHAVVMVKNTEKISELPLAPHRGGSGSVRLVTAPVKNFELEF
jgi:hypothetical protein